MRIRTLLPVLGALIWSAPTVWAQTPVQFITEQNYFNRAEDRQFNLSFRRPGAEALGMGGAWVAVSSTPVAALWNPAGLAQLDRTQVTLGGGYNLNTQEVNTPATSGLKVISDIDPALYPAFASVNHTLRLGERKMTAGLVYHELQSFHQKLTDTFYLYPSGTIAQVENPQGSLHAFTPSLAAEVLPGLFVGASYHFLGGRTKYSFKMKSPFADQFEFFSFSDKESYSGSFALIGFLAQPTRWLAIGAALTPPWQYTLTEEQEKLSFATSISGAEITSTTRVTPPDSLQEYKLDLPLMYDLGVAVKPGRNFTLACDYAVRPWSQTEVTVNGSPAQTSLLDGDVLRLGVEHVAAFGRAQVPLRMGYYTSPGLYKDRYFQGQFLGRQNTSGVFTFGAGVISKTWAVQLAFESGSMENEWWMTVGDYYNDRISSTKRSFNELTVTVGYRLK